MQNTPTLDFAEKGPLNFEIIGVNHFSKLRDAFLVVSLRTKDGNEVKGTKKETALLSESDWKSQSFSYKENNVTSLRIEFCIKTSVGETYIDGECELLATELERGTNEPRTLFLKSIDKKNDLIGEIQVRYYVGTKPPNQVNQAPQSSKSSLEQTNLNSPSNLNSTNLNPSNLTLGDSLSNHLVKDPLNHSPNESEKSETPKVVNSENTSASISTNGQQNLMQTPFGLIPIYIPFNNATPSNVFLPSIGQNPLFQPMNVSSPLTQTGAPRNEDPSNIPSRIQQKKKEIKDLKKAAERKYENEQMKRRESFFKK